VASNGDNNGGNGSDGSGGSSNRLFLSELATGVVLQQYSGHAAAGSSYKLPVTFR
jgi:hypothetical protein